MALLLIASFIWAFSFGLIKGKLVGLDSAFITAARLGLALVVFMPLLRLRGLGLKSAASLVAIGGVQFGLMYLAYNESFRYLQAHEVALFTITTPIFVTLLADALDRTLRPRALLAAIVAVAGTAVIAYKPQALAPTLLGLLLVQLSNAAFAIGQIAYRRVRQAQPQLRDRDVFGLLYAGGCAVALCALALHGTTPRIDVTATQGWTLVYLGVVASGLAFFLWNVGGTRVTAGTLAVMNNVKIPLAVACSLLFFHEEASLPRLLVSGALLALAVWLAEPTEKT